MCSLHSLFKGYCKCIHHQLIALESRWLIMIKMFQKWWNRQRTPIKAAYIGGASVIIAACCTVIGTFAINWILSSQPREDEKYSNVIPTAGAQLDFAPISEIDPSTIVEDLKLKPSPFNGIFLSELNVNRETAESWRVFYKNGEARIAESDICLSNIHPEAGSAGGPLNVKVSRVALDLTIYTDYRYQYEIYNIEIVISSFINQQQDSEIAYVMPSMPGAGGNDGLFRIIQTERAFIEGDNKNRIKVDFHDFILKPNNGVRIFIPVTFHKAGDYIVFVKINGNAEPVYDDEKGNLTLTTGVKSYQWARLDDPRKYGIREDNNYPTYLIPCP